MQRREFIIRIGTIGAVGPRSLVAQPADQSKKKMVRIGFLASVPHDRIDAFDRGLREQGYVEGENIIIERRFWKNDPKQLARFAAELVALDVHVIVAPTTPEALAAKAVTSTIPIVTATADAVGVGLAASLARPGGNVTQVHRSVQREEKSPPRPLGKMAAGAPLISGPKQTRDRR